MALEAVVFKQVPFNECKDFHALLGVGHLSNEGTKKEQTSLNVKNLNEYDPSSSFVFESVKELDTVDSSSENYCANGLLDSVIFPQMEANIGRQKRRRTSTIAKNNEEVENQRMIHIVVERNRRKQMNDYLTLLRSMMPSSFVQRGDQASIVEGAINYLKELEQVVQFQEANKRKNKKLSKSNKYFTIFSELFSFPQYSTCSAQNNSNNSSTSSENRTLKGKKRSAIADVEVTMMESYANIKLLLKRNQKQLLKLVVGLHFLNLLILHLNVTTVESMVLYCFSVKVGDECNYSSVNDIAASVYEMVGRIQEEEEAGF